MDTWVHMNWKSEYLCSRQGSERTLRLAKEVVPLQIARKCELWYSGYTFLTSQTSNHSSVFAKMAIVLGHERC